MHRWKYLLGAIKMLWSNKSVGFIQTLLTILLGKSSVETVWRHCKAGMYVIYYIHKGCLLLKHSLTRKSCSGSFAVLPQKYYLKIAKTDFYSGIMIMKCLIQHILNDSCILLIFSDIIIVHHQGKMYPHWTHKYKTSGICWNVGKYKLEMHLSLYSEISLCDFFQGKIYLKVPRNSILVFKALEHLQHMVKSRQAEYSTVVMASNYTHIPQIIETEKGQLELKSILTKLGSCMLLEERPYHDHKMNQVNMKVQQHC